MKVDSATRLKEIMAIRNLKQVDVIRLCKPFCEKYEIKLSKNHLSQYLSGKCIPKQDKLFILSNALNVSEAWLMGFDVSMERKTEEDTLESASSAVKKELHRKIDLLDEETLRKLSELADLFLSRSGNK